MGEIRDDIDQLEARIEALTASLERCRKISLLAKIVIAAGAAWFALVLLWIVLFSAAAFVAALSAVLGGLVLLGSNATTWEQTAADLHAAETERAQLIGSIDLRVVGEEKPTLH
ncbi:MAG: hypothetical protein HY244_16675 [Rhizobiales bacterium]|nr:hypothetical protein [Hyphomicrobiales bacterium]